MVVEAKKMFEISQNWSKMWKKKKSLQLVVKFGLKTVNPDPIQKFSIFSL